MQRDKTIEHDFKENQTRIRLSQMSVEAVKKKNYNSSNLEHIH
jgi:hypothetical protein